MNLTAAQTKLKRELIYWKIGQKKNNQTEKYETKKWRIYKRTQETF